MTSKIFLCSFSGHAAELKRGHRTPDDVLAALARNPRVSTWDLSENAWLWKAVEKLTTDGMIEPIKEPYPWHRYKVTYAGLAALERKG